MVEVFAVKIEKEPDHFKIDKLLTYVSKQKYDKISKFMDVAGAMRATTADLIVRYLACRKLNLRNEQLVFAVNSHGKPFLRNHKGFQFNISHSGDLVVCAVDYLSVGIDVELIDKPHLEVAKRFFTRDEYRDLISKEGFERVSDFYRLWTLKESYIKAVGRGLSIPLNSFSIQVKNGHYVVEGTGQRKENYFLKQYDVGNDYKLAVCSPNNKFVSKVIMLGFDGFYEEVTAVLDMTKYKN